MPPSYPGSVKSFSALTDGVDQIVVAHPNERGDEIEAIETELGTNPADKTGGVAATYATVKARLDKSHRAATFVVAASDASLDSRQFADYLCDGTADNVQIQAALDALPAGGGKVLLTEGTFTLAAQVLRAINNIDISGSGRGTRLNLNGSTAVISAGSQAGWSLLGFDTDAGGVDVASASEFLLDYWKNGARETEGVGVHTIGGAKHTGSLTHGDLSDAPTDAHHPEGIRIINRNLTQIDVESTTTETLIYSHSIPAGAMGSDGGFRLRLSGNLLSNAAGALTIRATFGGTEVILSNARGFTQSGIRHRWMLDILCINSAADAQLWDSNFTAILGVAGITLPLVLTETSSAILGVGDSGSAEDTTGALTFDVTVQWSLNSANLNFRKKIALLELLPAA